MALRDGGLSRLAEIAFGTPRARRAAEQEETIAAKSAGDKPTKVAPTANSSTASDAGQPAQCTSARALRGAAAEPISARRLGALSPFRLLLFVAFSWLSLQATRNTHQFAAVVGAVTAWNFGEWAAAIRRPQADAGHDRAVSMVAAGAAAGFRHGRRAASLGRQRPVLSDDRRRQNDRVW